MIAATSIAQSSKRAIRNFATATHEIFNQSKPLVNYNLYDSDPALKRSIQAYAKNNSAESSLTSFGKVCGSEAMMEQADLAEKQKPTLRNFDNQGRRIDVIDYHPSYHTLMKNGLSAGAASHGYNNAEAGSHVIRAGLIYMDNQLEPGHCCPVVMTSAAVPVLRNAPGCEEWLKKVNVQDYDHRNVPISEKNSVTMGMSMTEKQGGSDVRANTTIAKPIDENRKGPGNAYTLRGHKWFTSAAMSDGFLTLAKINPNDPPSCFLVPRWLPDGTRNSGFRIMRLKEKCADRANASSEIEYDDAWALLISEEGRGVKTIIDMVQSTRMDCALGSAGGGRRALQCALNHASSRSAFGKMLRDQPLMENVLADLCIEAEANTMMAMRMASAYDRYERGGDDNEKELFRVGVSVTKYFVTKRQPQFVYECMEVYGGNSFAEDHPMAKLFRHSPLNSIWEGSGNVIALDILRGAKAIPMLLSEIGKTKGVDASVDAYFGNLVKELKQLGAASPSESQRYARLYADKLAIALQASILLQHGSPNAAKGYIQSRIRNNHGGLNYGSFVFESSLAKALIDENMPLVN